MSEQDFYLLNGNSYRGSRYGNFAGGGTDPQGNVSSVATENSANQAAGTSKAPPEAGQINPGAGMAGVIPAEKPVTPPTMGQSVKDLAIGAAVPFAASTVGSVAGAAIGAGAGVGEGLTAGVKGIGTRLSSGLLGGGGGSTATNAALSQMGGKFGPAPASSVGKAATGSGIGGAAGTGLGTAAATLLTGGSVKDAAISGIGSGVGFAIGNAIAPGIGGFIGSTLGGMVGSVFGGGKEKRATLGAVLDVGEDGKYKTTWSGGNANKKGSAAKYGDAIATTLNLFGDATGIKYKNRVISDTNIGNVDKKTRVGDGKNWTKQVVSKGKGDVGAVALSVLKNQNNYEMGGDTAFNDFFSKAVKESKTLKDLGSRVDTFQASRGLTGGNVAQTPNTNVDRRFGDRAVSFAG
jgi:hypothetical protein